MSDTVWAHAKSSRPGAASSRAIARTSRSRSRANVRCAVPDATPTATSTSAAASRCAASPTTRATSWSARFMALVDRHRPLHVSIVGGEPLVRYRELDADPAAARRAADSHAARHERGAADSAGMGGAAEASGRRVDRRPAAGARRAAHAGHLRPDPEAHRRTPDHGALHGDAAAGAARRLPRGVPAERGRTTRTPG